MKSYRLLIRPEAEFDLAAAYRWYEDKDAGLGEEFLRTIEASLLGVQKNPQSAYEAISLRDILPHR
jgi:hypothetical protein